jgi:hypothetical protein
MEHLLLIEHWSELRSSRSRNPESVGLFFLSRMSTAELLSPILVVIMDN